MKSVPIVCLAVLISLFCTTESSQALRLPRQGATINADSNRTDSSGSRLRRQRTPRPPRPGVFTSLDSARRMPDSVIILSLRGKGLTSITGIAAFRNLQVLDLADNELASFPTEIAKLTNVLNIDLSNNPIKAVPNEIGSLTQMTRLNLRNTSITTLPATIGQCRSLSSLDVSRNPLVSLPIKELNRLPLIKSVIIGGLDPDAALEQTKEPEPENPGTKR